MVDARAVIEQLEITATERDDLNVIAQGEAAMIARVRDWALINSSSFHDAGLEAMRARIEEAMAETGGEVRAVELPESEQVLANGEVHTRRHTPAALLEIRPDAPVQIIMTGHHDTVFPKDSHFQGLNDWDEDTLNGPGVADMKGGIIVALEALKAFERRGDRQRVGVRMLISPDEEIGSPASAPIIAELGAKAHMGMTYEPALADGSLAGARKGSGNWSVVLRGRAAHAGREHHLGRNALEAAAALILELQSANGMRDGVTFNVGKVEGGGPVNIVPDLAVVRFNTRLKEPEDTAFITHHIDACVARANARDGISAELHGGFTRPPKPMAPANAAVFSLVRAAGQALGLDIRWNDTGGVCEGNNLWSVGCPNVDTLGVRGADIHSDREIVKLSSFVERAQLSYLMLAAIARGEFDPTALRKL